MDDCLTTLPLCCRQGSQRVTACQERYDAFGGETWTSMSCCLMINVDAEGALSLSLSLVSSSFTRHPSRDATLADRHVKATETREHNCNDSRSPRLPPFLPLLLSFHRLFTAQPHLSTRASLLHPLPLFSPSPAAAAAFADWQQARQARHVHVTSGADGAANHELILTDPRLQGRRGGEAEQ